MNPSMYRVKQAASAVKSLSYSTNNGSHASQTVHLFQRNTQYVPINQILNNENDGTQKDSKSHVNDIVDYSKVIYPFPPVLNVLISYKNKTVISSNPSLDMLLRLWNSQIMWQPTPPSCSSPADTSAYMRPGSKDCCWVFQVVCVTEADNIKTRDFPTPLLKMTQVSYPYCPYSS